MSQISRLKDAEITNGNLINADDLDAEFNELYSESNSQDTRIDSLESGAMTISGNKTFSGTNTHSGPNTFSGAVNITGQANLGRASDPGSPNDGDVWYNTTSDAFKVRIDGATKTLIAGLPINYINGPVPVYATAATITIPAGLRVRSSDDTDDLVVGSNITLDLSASGAAGLDTGSEASSTWYYAYLIKKSSDGTVSAVFSTTNEAASGSITYPTDYDLKRQLPIAIRNDGSSNIRPFRITGGWPRMPKMTYTAFNDGAAAGYTVLNGGSATSFTAVNLASIVPPISKACDLTINTSGTTSASMKIRETGSGADGYRVGKVDGSGSQVNSFSDMPCAGQSIDYLTGDAASSLTLSVAGFTVTEIY